MYIREASLEDKPEIIRLYEVSQASTGVPKPDDIPPGELGKMLYARDTISRFVAVDLGVIVGHGHIERANPNNMSIWQSVTSTTDVEMVELGGAFTKPSRLGEGIWTTLLEHRLNVVRKMGAIPVSATWSTNEHVKQAFLTRGATFAGSLQSNNSVVNLFVW